MSKIQLNNEPSLKILNQNIDRIEQIRCRCDSATLSVQGFEKKYSRNGLWNKLRIWLYMVCNQINRDTYNDFWIKIEFKSDAEGQKLIDQLEIMGVDYDPISDVSMWIKYRDNLLYPLLEKGAYFRIRE